MKFFNLLILIFGLIAFANAQKTVLGGTLEDSNGAVFAFTKVEIINEKGKIFETKSDQQGKFAIKLTSGFFAISAEFVVNSALYKSRKIVIYVKKFADNRQDLILLCTESSRGECPVVVTFYCN